MGAKMAFDAKGDKLFAGRVRIITTPPSRHHRLAAASGKPDDYMKQMNAMMELAQDWMKQINAMMEELEEVHSSLANISIADQLEDKDTDEDEENAA